MHIQLNKSEADAGGRSREEIWRIFGNATLWLSSVAIEAVRQPHLISAIKVTDTALDCLEKMKIPSVTVPITLAHAVSRSHSKTAFGGLPLPLFRVAAPSRSRWRPLDEVAASCFGQAQPLAKAALRASRLLLLVSTNGIDGARAGEIER